jgi:predicted Ser/Thr protein kinase
MTERERKMDLRSFLGGSRPRSLKFSEFIEVFIADPLGCLHTSSTLISQAIQSFGFEIVVRSGEPAVSYSVFKDPFSNRTNAVFGQEYSIKRIVDVIESVGKESSPQRGIVLVGPPASGKTNIVDLVSLALEEYSKHAEVKLYSFYFRFENKGRVVEFRPKFRHNPVLLFPTSLQLDGATTHPRQEFFEFVNRDRPSDRRVLYPTFYQNATIDKRSLDIVEKLMQNPRNAGKTLFDIFEDYVRVEEIDFSNAQAKGIANIDDMRQLRVDVRPVNLGKDHREVVNEHLPGAYLYQYEGAMVAANRGLLHIHDAFGGERDHRGIEEAYKPLLMLLGSGKSAIESTQTPVDTTVIATTNIEEMTRLEQQLTSSKLLDRIDEVPVNYLLDAHSEMDILKRDMANLRDKYDVDPNLLRISTYFSVLTRLLPPAKVPPLASWSDAKKSLYCTIAPEQKLFIYSAQAGDPMATIKKLPEWHPFRSELIRLGLDIHHLERYENLIVRRPDRLTLEQSSIFSVEQLKMIDDDFMRALWTEHYPDEGKNGISVRQLQNLMRDTISGSNGFRVHVGTFFSRLKKTLAEGPALHRWIPMDEKYRKDRKPFPKRLIGLQSFGEGEGDYGDFQGLVKVVQAIYNDLIRREITVATVNRDPQEIAVDLRKYVQHVLLLRAHENRAFAHIMVRRFTYFDPVTGAKVDEPDMKYMVSIERILASSLLPEVFRRDMAERFLEMYDAGELVLEEGKSLVGSRGDNFLAAFGQEYQRLLSHRRTVGDVNPEQLRDALFQKRMKPEKYDTYDEKVRKYADEILANMQRRFGYSRESALDTILFALRKHIIDFESIIS